MTSESPEHTVHGPHSVGSLLHSDGFGGGGERGGWATSSSVTLPTKYMAWAGGGKTLLDGFIFTQDKRFCVYYHLQKRKKCIMAVVASGIACRTQCRIPKWHPERSQIAVSIQDRGSVKC